MLAGRGSSAVSRTRPHPPTPLSRRAGRGGIGVSLGPDRNSGRAVCGNVWRLTAYLSLLACLAGLDSAALAQTTQGERAFVYGINAAIPGNYVGTFAPRNAATIYVLAGATSIISPRYTEIYFWPITNAYRANWQTLNEPVPGTLEVLRNGSVVAELTPTDYTIHFRQDTDLTTSAELFLGAEAVSAEEQFRTRQEEFREASDAYSKAEQAWMEAVADANTRRQAGEEVALPPAPERPAPIGVFSNGLNHGIPIDLEPGQYQIRLRGEDGEVVSGSERGLVVFAARRSGIGYTVVPETRWTTPDESPAPGDVIVGAEDSTLYLEPHQAREYPARDWALLQDPQRAAGAAGGWEWVNGERLTSGTLDVVAADGAVTRHDLTPFRVKQTPGSQLGYEVIPADAPEAQIAPGAAPRNPDFAAFPIALAGSGEQLQVALRSEQGEALAGSQRLIRVPENPPITRLFILPVVPLVIGGIVISRRRRPARLSPDVSG